MHRWASFYLTVSSKVIIEATTMSQHSDVLAFVVPSNTTSSTSTIWVPDPNP